MEEKERDLPLTLHSSNACDSQSWARQKPRTRNSIWASTWVAGTQALELSSAVSQGASLESWVRNAAARTPTGTQIRNMGALSKGTIPYVGFDI